MSETTSATGLPQVGDFIFEITEFDALPTFSVVQTSDDNVGQRHPVKGWRWVNGGRGSGHVEFPARVLRVGGTYPDRDA